MSHKNKIIISIGLEIREEGICVRAYEEIAVF